MRERKKAHKLEAARCREAKPKSKKFLEKEAMMRKHVEEKGWTLCEHGSWKICLYDQYNEVYKTLAKAYKMQLGIDSKAAELA